MSIGSPASRSSCTTEPRPSRRISCTSMLVRPSSTETGRLRSSSMLMETSPSIASPPPSSAKSALIGSAPRRFIASISDIVFVRLRGDIVHVAVAELPQDLHGQPLPDPPGRAAETQAPVDEQLQLGVAGDAGLHHAARLERAELAHREPEIRHAGRHG